MINKNKKILVTCALPYANGPIHLGHMLEHIQADIWVRYQRMQGNIVYFICADDAHGTPIMIKAKKLKINIESMIKKINKEHKKDFLKFNISYNNYYSTHSKENLVLCNLIFNRLRKKKLINIKNISQLYDKKISIFLPDRYVKGTCPKCFSINQYGDNCEICSAVYDSINLINPKSILSNSIPIIRNSKHFFFNLPKMKNFLYKWINSNNLQKEVINKIKEWFISGLKSWDISRDDPYFGFEIPGTIKKYFYVWLDAPIGYMGTFKNLCNKEKNIKFKDFWNKDSKNEIYHFIGKDIIYFHCLFWPALLKGSNFKTPTNLFVHGYLTINGKKMSKSKGTFIKASTYLVHLDPDYLRYYFASKLSSKINDIDFNVKNFVECINVHIINKIVNLASRCSKFIEKEFSCYLSNELSDPILYDFFINSSYDVKRLFNSREFSSVIKKVIELSDIANKYIDEKKPWILKNKKNKKKLQNVCSMGINFFKVLMIYLKPIVPSLSIRVEKFLNIELSWNNIKNPLFNHKIKPFKFLMNRLSISQVNKIINN